MRKSKIYKVIWEFIFYITLTILVVTFCYGMYSLFSNLLKLK